MKPPVIFPLHDIKNTFAKYCGKSQSLADKTGLGTDL